MQGKYQLRPVPEQVGQCAKTGTWIGRSPPRAAASELSTTLNVSPSGLSALGTARPVKLRRKRSKSVEERLEGGPDLVRRAKDGQRLRNQRLGLDPAGPGRPPAVDAHRTTAFRPPQILVVGPS
jgi:hypothetical protein